jgi:hypothetical protein
MKSQVRYLQRRVANVAIHRPRPGVPGCRSVWGVGGVTGVIHRSLAGASYARATSRAARPAAIPICTGQQALSTQYNHQNGTTARNKLRDSDGSAARCGRYAESVGVGCAEDAVLVGLVVRRVRAWRM